MYLEKFEEFICIKFVHKYQKREREKDRIFEGIKV